MKFQILVFFLLSVVLLRTQSPEVGYFYLLDSSSSTMNSPDGEAQYFDYSTGINIEFPYNTSERTNLFQNMWNFMVNNFSIPSKHINHGHVRTIKTYWRHAGYLPKALVHQEMNLSNQQPAHVAGLEATMASVEYLFYKMPIPAEHEPYQVKHQLLEICVQFPGNDYRHFIVDRGYRGIYPDTWNTKLRIVYVGTSDDCETDDADDWAHGKAGNWSDNGTATPHLHVIAEGEVIADKYHLDDLFDDLQYYFQRFPNYNTLYNCQHFATNLFNHLTGQNITFPSVDVMEILDENGESNLPKLQFGYLPLPLDEEEEN